MPIYEYQCSKCGHHHEALQKISDPPLRKCPDCGRQTLTRLVSAVRFRLSGSGWYETDFKSDKEQKRNLVEKGDKESAPTAESTESAAVPKGTGDGTVEPAKSRTMVTKPTKPAAALKPKPASKKAAPRRARKR